MNSATLVDLLARLDRATHELHVVAVALSEGSPVDEWRLRTVLAEIQQVKNRLRRATTY